MPVREVAGRFSAAKRGVATLALLVAAVAVPVAAGVPASAATSTQAGPSPQAVSTPHTITSKTPAAGLHLRAGTVMLDSAWQSSLARAACTKSATSSPAGPAGPAGSAGPAAAAARGAAVALTTCTAWRLVFTDPMPVTLRVGQILVSRAAAKLPKGLLAQVAVVTTSGGQTFVTARASLPQNAFAGRLKRVTNLGPIMQAAHLSFRNPHIRIVPAGEVPAAVKHKLHIGPTGHAVAAATTSCTAFNPPSNTAAGLFVEVSNARVPNVGFISKLPINLYLSGWVYIVPTFTFTFNAFATGNNPVISADLLTSYDASWYIYVGPSSKSDSVASKIINLNLEFPIGHGWTLPPVDAGDAGIIIPTVKMSVGIQGNFMVGGMGDYSASTSIDSGAGMTQQGKIVPSASNGQSGAAVCVGLGGSSDVTKSTTVGGLAGVKGQVFVALTLAGVLDGAFGLGVSVAPFAEAWLTATVAGLCPNVTAVADFFEGAALSFEFAYGPFGNAVKLGDIGIGVTGTQESGPWNLCQLRPPPLGSPVSTPGPPGIGGPPGTGLTGDAFPAGEYYLAPQSGADCPGIAGGSTIDNAAVVQINCGSESPSQYFQFNQVPGGPYGELQDENSGKDIVVQDGRADAGAPIVQYDQNGAANALWLPMLLADGTYQFKNDNSGMCLDPGPGEAVGAPYVQLPCKSLAAAEGSGQAYSAVNLIPYNYDIQFTDSNSGDCLDILGKGTANSTPLVLYPCKDTLDPTLSSQVFKFFPVSLGYGELQNDNSGKDIVVQGARSDAGAPVIQYDRTGAPSGLWRPIPQRDGGYQFQNQNSGLCLAVTGASAAPNTQLQQSGCKSPALGTSQDFQSWGPGQAPESPPPPGSDPRGWVQGHAAHAGNDYPYEGLGLYERHDGIDPWNQWYGQCDSFASWKVYENMGGTQRPPFRPDKGWSPSDAAISPVHGSAAGDPTNGWGDANNWGNAARAAGYTVDNNPAPGAIAYWDSSTMSGNTGHVAYVTDVYSDQTIELENYNLRLTGQYSTLHMGVNGADDSSFGDTPWHVNWPTGFIHIHDGSVGPAQLPPATAASYPANTWGPGSPTADFSLAGAAYPGTTNGWYGRRGHGLIGAELYTYVNGTSTTDSSATWSPALTANQCYVISAFIPDNYADDPTARYTVTSAGGSAPVVINQEAYTNAWAPLGAFRADSGGSIKVTVGDAGTAGYFVAADAVQFVPSSCADLGAASIIIDPSSSAQAFYLGGSGTGNGWYSRTGHGLLGNEKWTNSNGPTQDSVANWAANGLNAGNCYAVAAYVPDNYSNADARYTIWDSATQQTAYVQQSSFTNQWAPLGTFRANVNGTILVQVSDTGPAGYYVAADAVSFTPSTTCDGSVGGTSPGGAYPTGVYGPGSAQFQATGWWASATGVGLAGAETWTHTNGLTASSIARWTPQLQPYACYTVSAYIPDNNANDPQAHYTIYSNSDSAGTSVLVNQQSFTNQYASLGTFQAERDGSLPTSVTDQGPVGYVVGADGLKYAPTSCASTGPGPSPNPGVTGGYSAGTFGPGSSQFSETGVAVSDSPNGWYTAAGHGLIGSEQWTHGNGATASSTATWDITTLSPGLCYDVQAYIPNYAADAQVTYRIWTGSPTPSAISVDQNSYGNAWANLGDHTAYSDGSMTVVLTDQGTGYVAADAMKFSLC